MQQYFLYSLAVLTILLIITCFLVLYFFNKIINNEETIFNKLKNKKQQKVSTWVHMLLAIYMLILIIFNVF